MTFAGDIGSLKDRRVHSRSAFGTTIEFRFFSEWPHTSKRGFMSTTETNFPGDITEEALFEEIFETQWMVEEDNFRYLLDGLDKTEV